MAKVLLLDSPSWRLFNPRMHCHLGILYLAGSLRAAGHDVKVLDCHRVTGWDGENLILHKEMMEPCDILGISATTANVNWGQEMVKDWPAKVKVLGGTHVSHIMEGPHEKFKRKKYFEGFDYLMHGECEEAFVQFCSVWDTFAEKFLKGWNSWDFATRNWRPAFEQVEGLRIPGLVWWDDLGIHKNQLPVAPEVQMLPGPAFDLWDAGFDKGALSSPSTSHEFNANELMNASMYTARGCPYGCTFCADARTKLREETLEQIEQQVAQLHSLGVRAIRFQDDTFSIKENRCMQIADILDKYGMKWRACTRVNLRNQNLFDYMASRGCTELAFGVEHGSARMLKAMNKGTTPEANELGIKMCQNTGMIAKAFLILGFPGENEESIQEMEEWVLRVRPDLLTLSLFQPFPGCDVFNHPDKYNVEIPDDAFHKFWQVGGEDTDEMLVLDLPTISKERLFYHRRRLIEVFDREICHADRRQMADCI
jgi:anaerobic magnesium-protoporphyrin IX monomethyl ester cyclase